MGSLSGYDYLKINQIYLIFQILMTLKKLITILTVLCNYIIIEGKGYPIINSRWCPEKDEHEPEMFQNSLRKLP